MNRAGRGWMMIAGLGAAGVMLLTGAAQGPARPLPELVEPVKLMAGGEPIAVEIGHAAPFVWDIDRDGRKDLLVGQFGRGATSGRCRVYLNRGTDAEPRFDSFTFLQAAGQDASMVPS